MPKVGPTIRMHKALIRHELRHGGRYPVIGVHLQWLRVWMLQRCKQWSGFDVAISGSNPILGALCAAWHAKQGRSVVWLKNSQFDAWDYPLCINGSNDDLLAFAGLPPMGERFFAEMAKICGNSLTICANSEAVFFEHIDSGYWMIARTNCPSGEFGDARRSVESWFWQAFSRANTLEVKSKPKRFGGGDRELVVTSNKLVLVSEILDGVERITMPNQKMNPMDQNTAKELRVGRARWHAQTPLEFGALSREDMRLALELFNKV